MRAEYSEGDMRGWRERERERERMKEDGSEEVERKRDREKGREEGVRGKEGGGEREPGSRSIISLRLGASISHNCACHLGLTTPDATAPTPLSSSVHPPLTPTHITLLIVSYYQQNLSKSSIRLRSQLPLVSTQKQRDARPPP